MGFQTKIAGFVRWVLTWPVLVVIALNLENATSEAGYATIINQHWKDAFPLLRDLYALAMSPWIWYPALIFAGAVLYEWVRYTSNKMEAKGSRYRLWLLKLAADGASPAFLRNGLTRKLIKQERDLGVLNARLAMCELPHVPTEIGDDERVNVSYGIYLTLVGRGLIDHAKEFLSRSNLAEVRAPQSP